MTSAVAVFLAEEVPQVEVVSMAEEAPQEVEVVMES